MREPLIRGLGASPGKASGEAVVIEGLEEFSTMPEGGVLVCEMTTPEWLPVMAKASAIVTDVGGLLSHAAIVCREYGIPAVVGTGNGREILASGGQVDVDGKEGVVYGER
jgi:phosphoenolpyruvate synthase/pyruvate phosphate dikinase